MTSTSWSMATTSSPRDRRCVGEPRAHEAPAAGDERAHDGSPYRLRARRLHPRCPAGRRPRRVPVGLEVAVGAGCPGVARRRSRGPGAGAPASAAAPSRGPAARRRGRRPGRRRRRGGPARRRPGHLLHGRPRRGDQGCPAGQGLEGRQAEPLVEGRVDGGRRRPQQGRHRLVGHVPGPDDPRGHAGRGRRPGPPRPPPSRSPPARTSSASGWRAATRANAPTRVGTSLRGSSVPTNTRKGGPPASRGSMPASSGGVGPGRGLVGPEPLGVHPVGGHEHLGVDPAPPAELLGGDPARADHRRRPPGRHAGWPGGRAGPWMRSCHSGSSKKLRSWTVTTAGTGERSGIV